MRLHRSILVLTSVIVLAVVWDAVAQPLSAPPPGISLEIVSVRPLTAQECTSRSPSDVIGLDMSVRLRLSVSERGIWYLASRDPVAVSPRGYTVRVSDYGAVWRFAPPTGGDALVSPGAVALMATVPSAWIVLPPFSAVEWEVLDSSALTQERRAITVFIKQQTTGEPIEVLSRPFDAPVRATQRLSGK